MEKDAGWSIFFEDNERYADFINGCIYGGEQLVTQDHIEDRDSGVKLKVPLPWGRHRYFGKARDMVRKVVCGVNFVIIGVESQESRDYAYPVRNMIYDAGEYDKQLRKIRKAVRRSGGNGVSAGEYLYGFRRDDKLKPVATFLLYAGTEAWEKPLDLWDMLDFTDIPGQMREKVQNYHVNVVDIRRLADTSVFRTDIKEVFDFIRYSQEKDKLRELVENREYFHHMEEDAFDVVVNYSHAGEMGFAKESYEQGGKVDMCKAIQDMLADSREEGFNQGLDMGELRGKVQIYVYEMHLPVEDIAKKLSVDTETVEKILAEVK